MLDANRDAVPTCTERSPVITSERGSRFVDRGACPMCGFQSLGIEGHGVLMDGTKVRTLTAHSTGRGRVHNGEARCLASGMRVSFIAGEWRGAL